MTDIKLHTQDLANLMVELERDDSPCFQAFYNLVASGSFYPLNEKELGPVRRLGTVFSPDEWASPVLTEYTPFETLPNPDQIRKILWKDIRGETSYHYSPSQGSPEKDGQAIVELLNNVSNPRYSKPGAILFMQSPSMERLCPYKVDWPSDGILGVSDITMAVSPASNVQDMEYHDTYNISTLLTGSKVWLAYPPLPHNIASLQAEYQALRKDTDHLVYNDLRRFQSGIAIMQQAGQTLIVPPFWMTLSLATQTSISCTHHVATAVVFPQRIKNINNFLTTNQLWLQEDEIGQHRLVTFATGMTGDLETVLADAIPRYKGHRAIAEICQEYETLRDGLRRILDAVEDKAIVRGLENKYRATWLKFLEAKSKKRTTCRLCKVRIQDMPTEGTAVDRLRQHFVDFHCLRSESGVRPTARK
ncbi:hypothetical protein OPT61_g7051 [Boeremia exigua]|uniref:Uncharacterized protein n=1 Tax=Boeremia exigua TaxID=749465 RepID=A0ACC2I4T4_9PLEO|nr:hypothetical protein OPT61_g7051 [Boeremia exigua]